MLRKYQKKQIEDIFETVVQANKQIVDLLKDKKNESALDLIAECQDAMINVGNTIEQWTSQDAGVVENIVIYCEHLFQLYEAVQMKKECFVITKRVLEESKNILNRFKKEVDIKYEILFLPYKASMWDSLESIWLAAVKDKKCECTIMPIPYYEITQTKQILRYEGMDFPKDLSITHYDKYDIANIKPDIIYIHNPYDDSNYVTRVDSKYYSGNLKKYTDMLVYVPYYVSRNFLWNENSITKGVINSHRVIVQSKEVKQIIINSLPRYINYKSEEEKEILNKTFDEKLLDLGSPKFDGVINKNKKDIILPDAWQEIIGNKKIVLYNIGISGILNGNKDILRKIKDVFEFFEEREDTVLWWRPHPLNKATYKSMRQTLLDEYIELENSYKSKKIGIYDDTPDISRAIIMGDMYYGTPSSLVELFGSMGKPVVYQNNYTLRNSVDEFDKTSSAYAYSYILIEDDLWFVSGNFNGLFKHEIINKKTIYMGSVPGEDYLSENLYQQILKVGDSLWLIPSRAKEIAEYNIKDGKFNKYKLPHKTTNKNQKFIDAEIFDNKIIMVSSGENGFLIFDLLDKTIQIYDSFVDKLKVINPSFIFSDKLSFVEDKVYIITHEEDKVIEFNISTKKYKIHNLKYKANKYHAIRYDGRDFIIVTSNGLIKWNKNKEEKVVIPSLQNEEKLFVDITNYRNKIYILAIISNCLYEIDGDDIKKIQLMNPLEEGWICSKMTKDLDKLIMIFTKDRENTKVIIFNLETYRIKSIDLMLPDNVNSLESNHSVFEKLQDANYNDSACYTLWETSFVNMNKILEDLKEDKLVCTEQIKAYRDTYANLDGSSGEKIHEKILKVLK